MIFFCEQYNFDNFEFSKVCPFFEIRAHVLSALLIILVKIYEKRNEGFLSVVTFLLQFECPT